MNHYMILRILNIHTEILLFIANAVAPEKCSELADATTKLKEHTDALAAAIQAEGK